MAEANDYLYSGSYDLTIKSWNLEDMMMRIKIRDRLVIEEEYSLKAEAYNQYMDSKMKKKKKGRKSGAASASPQKGGKSKSKTKTKPAKKSSSKPKPETKPKVENKKEPSQEIAQKPISSEINSLAKNEEVPEQEDGFRMKPKIASKSVSKSKKK